MRNSITRFHAHAHLVRKITTSEIWEIIPHLAYMKIMQTEYLVCNKIRISYIKADLSRDWILIFPGRYNVASPANYTTSSTEYNRIFTAFVVYPFYQDVM